MIVAATVEEAYEAIDDMLLRGAYGGAGAEVVVEEFLTGEEASFFALVDGEACIPLVGAQVSALRCAGLGSPAGRGWR